MSWHHVTVEVFCNFPNQDGELGDPPIYCKYGPGRPNVHCLTGEIGLLQLEVLNEAQDASSSSFDAPCCYAIYGRARTAVVLTNEIGEEETSKTFWTDESVTSEQWNQNEEIWIQKMTNIINE